MLPRLLQVRLYLFFALLLSCLVGFGYVSTLDTTDSYYGRTSGPSTIMRSEPAPAVITDCSKGQDLILFDHLDVDPKVPQRSHPITMAAHGMLKEAMSAGNYTLTVFMKSSKVFQHHGNACGNETVSLPAGVGKIEVQGLNCPAQSGEVHYGMEVTLPWIAPSSTYHIQIEGSVEEKPLMCISVELVLSTERDMAGHAQNAIAVE